MFIFLLRFNPSGLGLTGALKALINDKYWSNDKNTTPEASQLCRMEIPGLWSDPDGVAEWGGVFFYQRVIPAGFGLTV
ncbi:MAG: hypothetical protein AB7W47_00225 [Calditrichaceae bacterium]